MKSEESLENAGNGTGRLVGNNVNEDRANPGQPVGETPVMVFRKVAEALKAAAGIMAMKSEYEFCPPEEVSLSVAGNRVECVLSDDVAWNPVGMLRFRAGQLVVNQLLLADDFGALYDNVELAFLHGIAEILQGHIGEIFDLAFALVAKGELKREEIKAILGRSADGRGVSGVVQQEEWHGEAPSEGIGQE